MKPTNQDRRDAINYLITREWCSSREHANYVGEMLSDMCVIEYARRYRNIVDNTGWATKLLRRVTDFLGGGRP